MGGEKVGGTDNPGVRTRLFALAALALFTSGVGWVGYQSYRAATDSFVAPIILSPDNDAVLTNKLKAAEIEVERSKAAAELEGIDEDLAGTDAAIARLEELRKTNDAAIGWTEAVTSRQGAATSRELARLAEQKAVLSEMVDKQDDLMRKSRANLEAGLISMSDYAKEEQATFRAQAALLETDRLRIQAELMSQQVALAQRSLRGAGGPPTPDQVTRSEQAVRIELEIMRLGSERRAKRSEKRLVQEKLAKIDEVASQLKARPIFRALERSMDVAFVPYTQAEGVTEGAQVYDCVWGLFHCRPVGTIAEVVPGEVILPDPWGNQSRGQYAVLALDDRVAARSKTLRVRPSGAAPAPAPSPPGMRVSSR